MDAVISNAIELVTVIQNNWEAIGGLAGFGALFAVVLQYLKVKFKLDERALKFTKNFKISGKGIMNALLIVITVVATLLETALQIFDIFPNAAVALPAIYLGITQAHRLLVSPAFSAFRKKLEDKRQQEADAEAYRQLVAAQKQAAMPAAPTEPRTAPAATGYDPTQVIQG